MLARVQSKDVKDDNGNVMSDTQFGMIQFQLLLYRLRILTL